MNLESFILANEKNIRLSFFFGLLLFMGMLLMPWRGRIGGYVINRRQWTGLDKENKKRRLRL